MPLYVMILCVLQGCVSFSSKENTTYAPVKNISLYATKTMNQGHALAVDLVAVFHDHLAQSLRGMTAQQYFSSIDQVRRDYPSFIKIWRMEIVPEQTLLGLNFQNLSCPVHALFLFSNYRSAGDHRIEITNLPYVALALNTTTMDFHENQTPLKEKDIYTPASLATSLNIV